MKKSLLALVAIPVTFLTTGCIPGQAISNVGSGSPAPASTTTTGIVKSVYDGDTITMKNNDKVRIIGIDTPELRNNGRGTPEQCGAVAARDLLRSMLPVGTKVALVAVPGRDNTDDNGRLLRYVETASADVGQAMIDSGWAHARYDGVDNQNYETHPRRDNYRASDAAHAAPACGW